MASCSLYEKLYRTSFDAVLSYIYSTHTLLTQAHNVRHYGTTMNTDLLDNITDMLNCNELELNDRHRTALEEARERLENGEAITPIAQAMNFLLLTYLVNLSKSKKFT